MLNPSPVTVEAAGTEGGAPPQTCDVVVLDTCVLVADPDALHAFGSADVVLPLTVIEELDGHKTRMDEVGRAARAAVRSIEELRCANGGDIRSAAPLPGGGSLRIEVNGLRRDLLAEYGLDDTKPDNRIMAAALGLKSDGRTVKLVSADCALRIKAAQLGLVAEDYLRVPGTRSNFGSTGWHTVEVTSSLVDELYSADTPVRIDEVDCFDADPAAFDGILTNEFAVLRAGSQSVLTRVHKNRELRRIASDAEAWGLRPRSKEQRFALDLLLDPDVPVVTLSGHAGTGKTILALAAGLQQVFERGSTYDRLMIVRPIVAVGRQEMGYLPGTLEEKLGPWFEAIVDAMVALSDNLSHREAKAILTGWVDEGRLTMESVTYLRGRSLQSTYLLADEVQNLEPLVAKTVLSRLGTGSKCVMVGDISQIDSPWLAAHSNALAVVGESLAGSDLFGRLLLTQGERSAVADLVADRM